LLFGGDSLILSAWKVGARGFVGATSNFAASIYQQVLQRAGEGDQTCASSLQEIAKKMIDVLSPWGVLNAGKALMRRHGINLGPCRLPLTSLTDAHYAQLVQDLDKAGILQHL